MAQIAENVSIREFIIGRDYEAVFQLWQHAGEGIQLRTSDSFIEIQKKINRDPDLFLVAVDGGDIVGAVLAGFDGRRGMIYHLAIDTGYRRRGIASVLMDEIETRLRSKGCIKYYLLVTPENEAALRFYQTRKNEIMDLFVLGKELT